jgi:hypothetical protein
LIMEKFLFTLFMVYLGSHKGFIELGRRLFIIETKHK